MWNVSNENESIEVKGNVGFYPFVNIHFDLGVLY